MYDVHFILIGKRVVDFLLVLIELFSLAVSVESLRAKVQQYLRASFWRPKET